MAVLSVTSVNHWFLHSCLIHHTADDCVVWSVHILDPKVPTLLLFLFGLSHFTGLCAGLLISFAGILPTGVL